MFRLAIYCSKFYSYVDQEWTWANYGYPSGNGPYTWTLEYGQLHLRNSRNELILSYGRTVGSSNAPTSLELELTDKNLCVAKIYDKNRHKVWASSITLSTPKY